MSYIIRKKGYDQWACIAPKGKDKLLYISWVGIDKATTFASALEAQTAFTKGVEDMHKSGQDKAARINAKGGQKYCFLDHGPYLRSPKDAVDYGTKKPLTTVQMHERILQTLQPYLPTFILDYRSTSSFKDVHVATLQEFRTQPYTHWDAQAIAHLFFKYGFLMRPCHPDDFKPQWIHNLEPQHFPNYFQQYLTIESQAHAHTFLHTQHTYFVRCPDGWLSCSKGMPNLVPQMQQASMFFDQHSARQAIEALTRCQPHLHTSDFALIQNHLVINQVIAAHPSKHNWMRDTQTAQLASACEALSIEQAIQTAVLERQKAHQAALNNPSTQPSDTSTSARKRL